jgi:SAM-dependent methyltransferase
LLDEAERQPFAGWDFSWLAGRTRVEPLPWDFEAEVTRAARRSPDLLDMGTGGGERLSQLSVRPALTVATESWPPNVPIAARRLRPLGIPVVQSDGAPNNVDQAADLSRSSAGGGLPFRSATFHLVTNRHESFVAAEVARVLMPGGRFLTQQIALPWADDFYRLLDLPLPPPPPRPWALSLAVAQVEAAGLTVIASAEGYEARAFHDVGAMAWYLKAISWGIPGFTIAGFRRRLARLHAQIAANGPLVIRVPHFWLEAQRRVEG